MRCEFALYHANQKKGTQPKLHPFITGSRRI